jgi:acyl-CoA synthetase (AMP-forming)/AMP-acid ligase II
MRATPALFRSTVCNASKRSMATAGPSAGTALSLLASQAPHTDVIRYEHKNLKWTLKHVDVNSDALAIGLLDQGFVKGDVVLSWLPESFAEQHVLQFACSKAGFVLYTLDPSASEGALAKALEITKANILITQEAGSDVNYIRKVEAVVPETQIFNFADGMPFFSPRFPHLRLPIHTGFDYERKPGFVPLHDVLCDTGDLEGVMGGNSVDGSSPLMGELKVDSSGMPSGISKVLSNEEVVANGAWPQFASILKKQYSEVEGVGVVF